eukprot:COSAG05_NODE_1935_length_3814_cov_2.663795_1_plen_374_part_00
MPSVADAEPSLRPGKRLQSRSGSTPTQHVAKPCLNPTRSEDRLLQYRPKTHPGLKVHKICNRGEYAAKKSQHGSGTAVATNRDILRHKRLLMQRTPPRTARARLAAPRSGVQCFRADVVKTPPRTVQSNLAVDGYTDRQPKAGVAPTEHSPSRPAKCKRLHHGVVEDLHRLANTQTACRRASAQAAAATTAAAVVAMMTPDSTRTSSDEAEETEESKSSYFGFGSSKIPPPLPVVVVSAAKKHAKMLGRVPHQNAQTSTHVREILSAVSTDQPTVQSATSMDVPISQSSADDVRSHVRDGVVTPKPTATAAEAEVVVAMRELDHTLRAPDVLLQWVDWNLCATQPARAPEDEAAAATAAEAAAAAAVPGAELQ